MSDLGVVLTIAWLALVVIPPRWDPAIRLKELVLARRR